MPKPLEQLTALLEGATRVAVLAAGSTLRGDDAAGMLAAEELDRAVAGRPTRAALAVFLGETAPENLTGEIRRFAPTHLVVLDAADLGREGGAIDVLHAEAATAGASFSSHKLPMGVLANYMRTTVGCQVIIVGIQPIDCAFGRPVAPAVTSAARQVAAALAAVVCGE